MTSDVRVSYEVAKEMLLRAETSEDVTVAIRAAAAAWISERGDLLGEEPK